MSGSDKELRDEDLRALGRSAAELSHELRNLLVGVVAEADLLAAGQSKDPRAAAGRIRAAAISCKALVDDVLALSRREPLPDESVQLGAFLEDLRDGFFRKRGSEIVLSLPSEEAWILGRRAALHRLLLNLLRNADQAAPEGAIEVTLDRLGRRHRITIRDEGPGVPADLAEKIFDPFYSSGKKGGTGLGLALARRVAEEHGGRLELDAGSEGGACFVLELPAAERPEPQPGPSRDDGDRGSGLRLLCIDDDETTRETYRMILGLEGHDVDCARDGKTALELAARRDHDVVLLDLRLPDMKAEQLVEDLKKVDPTLSDRIIFATGDLMNEESRRFLARAGRPYLAKPFRIEDLRLAIELMTRD